MTAHTGEDTEKGGHSSIASGTEDLYNEYGNQYGGSSEKWKSIYLKTQLYLSKDSPSYNVHCKLINNSQKMETIYMSFKRRTDK